MYKLEEQEIAKSRPGVKNKSKEVYKWLLDYVPKPIKSAAGKAFSKLKSSILSLYDDTKKALKYVAEKEAGKENQEQREDEVDLTH